MEVKLHLPRPPGIAVAAAAGTVARDSAGTVVHDSAGTVAHDSAAGTGAAGHDSAAGTGAAGHDVLGLVLVLGRQDGCKPQPGHLPDNDSSCSVGRCSTHR